MSAPRHVIVAIANAVERHVEGGDLDDVRHLLQIWEHKHATDAAKRHVRPSKTKEGLLTAGDEHGAPS
jgi:hypothetical protein